MNTTLWPSRDILALSFLKGMNSSLLRTLVEQSPGLEQCMLHSPNRSLQKLAQQDLFTSDTLHQLQSEAEDHLELCRKGEVRIVSIFDGDYPQLLRNISYPPTLLFVRGKLQAHDSVALGIVGTRRCTHYGRVVTERFASECSAAGLVIVSGMAYGVDTIAHEVTLKTGGITYAVIASGVDCVSPHTSNKCAERIVQGGGAILSEYRCGTKALPAYFPQRNRIISGIARAVLVVESGLRGGSLITAQFAVDQSRELYAIPGSILNERSEGANELLRKQMAQPALSPVQILHDLGLGSELEDKSQLIQFGSDLEEQVYRTLGHDPMHVDEIAEKLLTQTNEILVALLMLEFKGAIRQFAGKMFMRE